jgi:hypothetical protein
MPFILIIIIIFIMLLCIRSESSFFKALLHVIWIVLSFIASVLIFTNIEANCEGWFNDCTASVHIVALIPITGVTLYILYLLKSKLT